MGSPLPEKRPFLHSGEFICYIIIFCPFSASIFRKCLYLRKGKRKFMCQSKCMYASVFIYSKNVFFYCPAPFLFMEYDNLLFVL